MKLNLPPKAIALAFLGGALGTVLRAVVGIGFNSAITLIVVNLLGAAFLGCINGKPQSEKPRFVSAESKWFWGAGFCGGFTTMSGLALAFVMLTANYGALPALLYTVLQFAMGLALYALAYRLGKGSRPSV